MRVGPGRSFWPHARFGRSWREAGWGATCGRRPGSCRAMPRSRSSRALAGRLGTRRWCGTGTSGSRRAFGSRSWTSPRAIYRRSSRGTTPGACASSRAWPSCIRTGVRTSSRWATTRRRASPPPTLGAARIRGCWAPRSSSACTPVRRCAPPSTTPPRTSTCRCSGASSASRSASPTPSSNQAETLSSATPSSTEPARSAPLSGARCR